MAFRQTTLAFSLIAVASIACSSGASAAEGDRLALNAPIHSASDPALRQAAEILSKNPKIKPGQTKRAPIFNSQPANDSTVVKHRPELKKDLDKVLILGGAEVLPM